VVALDGPAARRASQPHRGKRTERRLGADRQHIEPRRHDALRWHDLDVEHDERPLWGHGHLGERPQRRLVDRAERARLHAALGWRDVDELRHDEVGRGARRGRRRLGVGHRRRLGFLGQSASALGWNGLDGVPSPRREGRLHHHLGQRSERRLGGRQGDAERSLGRQVMDELGAYVRPRLRGLEL
jgi:hypothetical protein